MFAGDDGGRVHPRRAVGGSLITYVETGLGPRAGVMTALLVAVGYTVAMTRVFTMPGVCWR